MKYGKYLKMDTSDFMYLTDETHYSFPIEDGWLKWRISADGPTHAYLINRSGFAHPLDQAQGEYRLNGFTEFLIKTSSKKTQLAVRIEIATAETLDPQDYTPVEIGPLPAVQENILMRQALQAELARRGIDDDGEFDPEEETDLDFFDDDDMGVTLYEMSDLPPEANEDPEEDPENTNNSEESEEQSEDETSTSKGEE